MGKYLKLEEWAKLPKEERLVRCKELSEHDLFLVRIGGGVGYGHDNVEDKYLTKEQLAEKREIMEWVDYVSKNIDEVERKNGIKD